MKSYHINMLKLWKERCHDQVNLLLHNPLTEVDMDRGIDNLVKIEKEFSESSFVSERENMVFNVNNSLEKEEKKELQKL